MPIGNREYTPRERSQTRRFPILAKLTRLYYEQLFEIFSTAVVQERKFHKSLVGAMANTVWVTGCKSWYLGPDGVPITWPWAAKRFCKDLRKPNLAEFDLSSA